MAELKIAEVILRERRKLKLTQEELANALMVSPQAVSNWERGGYPDITLLPRIANYFKITVDELIGNDEASHQADVVTKSSAVTTSYSSPSLVDHTASSRIVNVHSEASSLLDQSLAIPATKLP